MLAMAVEAFRQLHDTSGLIQSIYLQDVEFKRALIFGSNTNAIETSLFLSATETKSDGSSWSHFKLFQIENNTHGECCSGFIRGEFDQNSSAVPGHLQEWVKDISSACCEPQNPYTLIDQTAMQYDHAFRVLEDLQRVPQTQVDAKLRADQAVAKLRTDNWKDSQTSDPQNQQFTFHPCTLDGLAQMLLLAVFCVKDQMLGLVPKRVSRVWIDCRIKAQSENQLRGIAKCVHVGRRSATTDIMATSLNLEPVVYFQGVEASFIESATRLGKNQTDSSSRPLCTRLIWKPETELLAAEAPENGEARPEDLLEDRVENLEDDIFVVRNPSHPYQNDMANLIAGSWPKTTVFTLEEVSSVDIPSSTIVVFLVELQELFLDGISETNFDLLRATLMKAQHVIWFTEPTENSSVPVPALGLVDGLSRVISSEDSSHKFITVALDGSETRERFLGMLSKVARSILDDPLDVMETAYSSNGGVFEMPRLCENDIVNDQVSSTLAPYQQDERQIDNLHASLHVGNPGSLQTLELVEHEMSPPTPLENQIVVRVKAFGLTWQDYLCATGAIDQLLMGTECAGVVEQIGPNVTRFQPGDQVFVIGEGLACTSVCVSADSAALMPSVITSFSEAASLPTSLWLAFYSLRKLANLEEGEWVLIQQAASSVGQMLIQMAMKRGAHVLATVSSPTKQKLLCERFKDLPLDRIFLHSDGEIVKKVQSVTNRSGIDVVIGSLENWSGADLSACLAAYARIIDIGVSSSHSSANIWRPSQRAANISRASVNLVELLQHKPTTIYRTFQQAVKFWFEKDRSTLKPLILDVFPASDIEAGFRRMQERDAVGKSIIELRQGLAVKIKTRTRPSYQLSSQSTYVISGGLGGLGRTLARWMVKRGARYLILLSRSGPKTSEARDLIRELEEEGATVATPKVDVGNLSELKETLAELLSSMPPIRGCIQGSMVLRDALFDNMTYEDWKLAIAAKADVSWNLHLTMPSELDFFILVSSVSGIIGNRGQANYAAGNTYQDALAHYRISQGLKAVTIDMGVMLNDGVAAENETLLNTIRKFGHLIEITQDEVLALFDYYCNPQLSLLSRDHVQCVVGLEMPSTIAAKGVTIHHSFRRPMFRELFEMGSVVYDSSKEGSINRPAALKSASEEEAGHLVTGWIALQVSHVLGLEETDIQVDKPLHAHGIDSLVAVDLKNWFFNELGAKVTVFDIMGNSSIQQIAAMVAKRSRFRSG